MVETVKPRGYAENLAESLGCPDRKANKQIIGHFCPLLKSVAEMGVRKKKIVALGMLSVYIYFVVAAWFIELVCL